VAEQAVEDVRNVEDGTKPREENPGDEWTPLVDAAMRDKTAREAPLGARVVARLLGSTRGRSKVVSTL